MATAKPGDPGQAGTYDPKTGGKFEPETTADPTPHSPHCHDDSQQPHPRPKPEPR